MAILTYFLDLCNEILPWSLYTLEHCSTKVWKSSRGSGTLGGGDTGVSGGLGISPSGPGLGRKFRSSGAAEKKC